MIALAITTATASAAATRTEYVAQVDPICHAADVRSSKALHKHHLKTAVDLSDLTLGDRADQRRVARQLAISTKIAVPAAAQIAVVPFPPGDEGILGSWVTDLETFVHNAARSVHVIRAGKPRRAYRLIVRSLNPLVRDDENLQSFGFQYCV
jgi:hypothetical protein